MDPKADPAALRAPLCRETVNQNVLNSEYAVRGEIVQMAQKLAKDLEAGGSHPFKKVVWCNIGNPQILGQKPITYFRQVLALCECPMVGAEAHAGTARGGARAHAAH
jgi:alanine transaminase